MTLYAHYQTWRRLNHVRPFASKAFSQVAKEEIEITFGHKVRHDLHELGLDLAQRHKRPTIRSLIQLLGFLAEPRQGLEGWGLQCRRRTASIGRVLVGARRMLAGGLPRLVDRAWPELCRLFKVFLLDVGGKQTPGLLLEYGCRDGRFGEGIQLADIIAQGARELQRLAGLVSHTSQMPDQQQHHD